MVYFSESVSKIQTLQKRIHITRRPLISQANTTCLFPRIILPEIMPKNAGRILHNPQINRKISLVSPPCDNRLIIMRRAQEGGAHREKLGKSPIGFAFVKAMDGSCVAMFCGVCGVPHDDCELGADRPVLFRLGGGGGREDFEVGGDAFFLVVSPGE